MQRRVQAKAADQPYPGSDPLRRRMMCWTASSSQGRYWPTYGFLLSYMQREWQSVDSSVQLTSEAGNGDMALEQGELERVHCAICQYFHKEYIGRIEPVHSRVE